MRWQRVGALLVEPLESIYCNLIVISSGITVNVSSGVYPSLIDNPLHIQLHCLQTKLQFKADLL